MQADIDRLERDEPFADVIPNFDSLAMLEIILLIEEKEGFQFDQHLDSGNASSLADAAAAYRAFPSNVSALGQALIQARQAEKLKKEGESGTPSADQIRASDDTGSRIENHSQHGAS
ncbi:hypothetical protein BAN20980_04280 [Burkholderia anthina]|uniref:Carrier domain-containing protein n=1 Tax=Burkholderia anthina TaxID=179879 RepID=A0A6P2GCX9_9BURK|nr:hypothetical protein BAN20980_04280 [Burkholderia anthina]